jgi:hypothetical protein
MLFCPSQIACRTTKVFHLLLAAQMSWLIGKPVGWVSGVLQGMIDSGYKLGNTAPVKMVHLIAVRLG